MGGGNDLIDLFGGEEMLVFAQNWGKLSNTELIRVIIGGETGKVTAGVAGALSDEVANLVIWSKVGRTHPYGCSQDSQDLSDSVKVVTHPIGMSVCVCG